VKIFVPGSSDASDLVASSLQAETVSRFYYSVPTGFRVSALLRPDFVDNFVKGGKARVYTAVERAGSSSGNLVSLSSAGDAQSREAKSFNCIGSD
jgi:hypothetical protein